MAFCLIIEERAASDKADEEDLLVNVHEALARLGIPRDEFYQVEKETEGNKPVI